MRGGDPLRSPSVSEVAGTPVAGCAHTEPQCSDFPHFGSVVVRELIEISLALPDDESPR